MHAFSKRTHGHRQQHGDMRGIHGNGKSTTKIKLKTKQRKDAFILGIIFSFVAIYDITRSTVALRLRTWVVEPDSV